MQMATTANNNEYVFALVQTYVPDMLAFVFAFVLAFMQKHKSILQHLRTSCNTNNKMDQI
jgi:hypothetical protein